MKPARSPWACGAALFFAVCLSPAGDSRPAPPPNPAAADAATPPVRIRLSAKAPVAVEVVGLAAADRAALAKLDPGAEKWAELFPVHVAGKKGAAADRPALLGSYRVAGSVLRFEPRFPLARGVRYRAVFDGARLPGRGKAGVAPVEAILEVPGPGRVASTVVAQVYPSAGRLPENQLKFYLHFSAPMGQGDSYRHIRLLNAKGKAIDLPFLELDQELWTRDGKRFTLFLDPGRIKRGLKPREEVGPVLEEGKRYTLVIDRAWADAEGNPLKETFRKAFSVTAPDDKPPDPKTWKLAAPAAKTRAPLQVTFPKPMDHAMLHRVVWVTDPAGRKVPGAVAVTGQEKVWRFTPQAAWQAGAHHLVADTQLEDLAGNGIGRPFEVDVFRPVERAVKEQTVRVPFEVRP